MNLEKGRVSKIPSRKLEIEKQFWNNFKTKKIYSQQNIEIFSIANIFEEIIFKICLQRKETFFNLIRHQSNLPWKLMGFFLVFFLLKMQNLNLFSSTWNPVVNYSLGNYFSLGENKVFSSKFFSNPIFSIIGTSYDLYC